MKSTITAAATTITSGRLHLHPTKRNQLAQLPGFAGIDFTEPVSVLDLIRGPSPTATTTIQSSAPFTVSGNSINSEHRRYSDPVAVAPPAASDFEDTTKLQWGCREFPSLNLPTLDFSSASPVEDLDSMLMMSVASPPQETSFVRWVFGEKDDPLLFQQMTSSRDDGVISGNNLTPNFNLADTNSNFNGNFSAFPPLLPPLYDSSLAESIVDEHFFLKQMPSQPAELALARFIRPKHYAAAPMDAVEAINQLVEAAGLVELGNLALAQIILARLDQMGLSPSGSPLLRSAYYFKEAILLSISDLPDNREISPFLSLVDLVHKIDAFKSFSEVSPILQFANFTSNQALLEALDDVDRIHIIDFDVGLGGQWASFMQELAVKPGVCIPALGVTAVVSVDSMELRLTGENLSHFAGELNIPFRFDAVDFRQFESLCLDGLGLGQGEVVAVSFSPAIRRELSRPDSVSGFLRFLKRLRPRIIVFVEAECDNGVSDHQDGNLDSSFRRQFASRLEFYASLMDSLDAAGVDQYGTVRRIEQFLLQPRINSSLAGLCRASSVAPGRRSTPWASLLYRSGFFPLPFSHFTETQAEYLLKRNHVKGFHVEKRHSSRFAGNAGNSSRRPRGGAAEFCWHIFFVASFLGVSGAEQMRVLGAIWGILLVEMLLIYMFSEASHG